ncbi:VOC family protein [Bacillus lacus]|uniref:VOC family protein n=1 Tax=Metabacillus lacus TaxID=1983721 RepID=A0A7X2IX16_9BACI|nr:VOC family protein [Metabacillus lacus]MRX71249.1 VOC family protein [Metabacillus lacus]
MLKIGSIFIPVTNLEKSEQWYERILGVKKIDSWGEGTGFYLPLGSTQLALIQVESLQPAHFHINKNEINSYYNFMVDDIESTQQHFRDNDVKTTEIEDFNGMKFFDFYDLDGNSFSVVSEVEDSPYHSDQVRRMQERNRAL